MSKPPPGERLATITSREDSKSWNSGLSSEGSCFQCPLSATTTTSSLSLAAAASTGMSLSLQQQNHQLITQAPPTPVPVSVSNAGNDAMHGRNGSQRNGTNDLDIDLMTTDETNDNVGSTLKDSTTATNDEDTETLRVGQVFANEKAFYSAVDTYCNVHSYDTKSFTTKNKSKIAPEVQSTYFRTICVRGGKFKSVSKGGEDARTRTSQKRYILRSNGSLTSQSVILISLHLEHTNGCKGADELVRATTKQLRGRKYFPAQISYLRRECQSGRYTTTNVKDWLTEQGHTNVTLKEATNLRYRLVNNKKIKGCETPPSNEEMGKMTDLITPRSMTWFWKRGNKLPTLYPWLRTNIQNTSANEVKAACADYLGITEMSSSSSFTDDASGGDERVLTQIKAPALLKRGAGAMSTKRHRSSVEVAVKGGKGTGGKGTTCKFCFHIGHTIKNCQRASEIGYRLTKTNWVAQMATVSLVDGKDMPSALDQIVPSDALGLQIVACVCHGRRSESSDHTKRIYCCNVVLKGMTLKECRQLWFERSVIDEWAKNGGSSSHYVFVKQMQ
eukprot:scaffold8603_cov155-Skeletonema_menzelii.AAC.16